MTQVFQDRPDAQKWVTSHAESEGGRFGVARDQDPASLGSRAEHIVAMRSGRVTSLKKTCSRSGSRDDLIVLMRRDGLLLVKAGSTPVATSDRRGNACPNSVLSTTYTPKEAI